MMTMRAPCLVGGVVGICLFGGGAAYAADPDFAVAPNAQSFSFSGGESQSTVVPPGVNKQCPGGRLLVTDDNMRPSNVGATISGAVHWRDLTGSAEGISKHEPVPDGGDYSLLTNDHDIVTLPSGDVIYEIGAGSKRPLNPKPVWFDYATRFFGTPYAPGVASLGPGARSTVLFWRSTDCGQTFKFVSEIDSAAAGHEDCAYPQGAGVAIPTSTGKNGGGLSPSRQPPLMYDMGGTDGQWLGVDRHSRKLIFIEQCVGQLPVANSSPFRLGADTLNKSYVFTSTDEAGKWVQSSGGVPIKSWRIPAVVLRGNRLALAIYGSIDVGTIISDDNWSFGQQQVTTPGTNGWPHYASSPLWKSIFYSQDIDPIGPVGVNLVNWTNISRAPGSNDVLLAVPEEIMVAPPQGALDSLKKTADVPTFGVQLYFYDPDTRTLKTADPILPLSPTRSSAIMHLTVVDAGDGPVLLYWYDLNATTKEAIVRGRLIFGLDQMSQDFDISRVAGQAKGFSLVRTDMVSGPYWYGDYKTAGAVEQAVFVPSGLNPVDRPLNSIRYTYYPMWIEPDHKVYYSQVSVTLPKQATVLALSNLKMRATVPSVWRKLPPQTRIVAPPYARMLEEIHERTRGPMMRAE